MDSSFKKGELSIVHLVYCDDKEKVLEKIYDISKFRNQNEFLKNAFGK